MKTALINVVFLAGASCVVASAFLVSLPLGLLVLGCPLVAVSLHAARKVKE
jgi:hypothetical protein